MSKLINCTLPPTHTIPHLFYAWKAQSIWVRVSFFMEESLQGFSGDFKWPGLWSSHPFN